MERSQALQRSPATARPLGPRLGGRVQAEPGPRPPPGRADPPVPRWGLRAGLRPGGGWLTEAPHPLAVAPWGSSWAQRTREACRRAGVRSARGPRAPTLCVALTSDLCPRASRLQSAPGLGLVWPRELGPAARSGGSGDREEGAPGGVGPAARGSAGGGAAVGAPGAQLLLPGPPVPVAAEGARGSAVASGALGRLLSSRFALLDPGA